MSKCECKYRLKNINKVLSIEQIKEFQILLKRYADYDKLDILIDLSLRSVKYE